MANYIHAGQFLEGNCSSCPLLSLPCSMILSLHNTLISLFTVQTDGGCDRSYNLNLTYHLSQNITHILLKRFYNGYTIHRRFIKEELLTLRINRLLKQQLRVISTELEQNIARLYYLVRSNILYTNYCICNHTYVAMHVHYSCSSV